MQERLAILGASTRAAAFSAVKAGIAPYAIDLFADRDLAAMCPAVKIDRYPADFPAALASATPSPWIYTGGLENHPRLVDRLAAERPLLGNGGRVLRKVRDPARLAAVSTDAGCLFPEWRAAPPVQSGNVWLLKPRRSSGGQSIRFAAPEDYGRTLRATYWQEYVEGQSASSVFVAARGQAVLLGTSRQLTGRDFGLDRPFLYAGSIAPLELPPNQTQRLTRLGNLLAGRFELQGLFNVDFLANRDGLWVLEVNPRYSASVEILERLGGLSFVRLHVDACRHQSLPDEPRQQVATFAGKAVVYARRASIVTGEFEALVSQWNRAGEPPGIADLPRIGQHLAAGEPVATVLAGGKSAEEVEAALRAQASAAQETLCPAV